MSSFGRFTQALGGVVESLSYTSPTLTLTQSVGVSPLTTTISGGGGISGSGTINYVPKFTGSTIIGNSQIFDNGTNVGIGTLNPLGKFDVNSVGYSIFASNIIGNRLIKIGTQSSSGESAIQATLIDGTPRFLLLNPDGANVLIGTNIDAGYKLSVNGTLLVSGGLLTMPSGDIYIQEGGRGILSPNASRLVVINNGNLGINGNLFGSGLLSTSDRLYINGQTTPSNWISSALTSGYDTTNQQAWIQGAGSLALGINGNTILLIDSNELSTFSSSVYLGASTIDPSAKFQVDSTEQGLLVPRMLETEITAITSPADGLLVYNLDQKVHCYWDSGAWHKYTHTNM